MTPVPSGTAVVQTGPRLRTRVAAVAVLIALAVLASYAMFSGPTRVSLGGSSSAAPKTAPSPAPSQPPAEGGEPEGGGGD